MARPNIQTTFSAQDKVSPTVKKMSQNVQRYSKNAAMAARGIGDAFRSMQRIAQTAMAFYASSRIIGAINDFATLGDEIAKTSKQLDIHVESLQKFRFAMERQGGSTESVDKAIQNMNMTVGKMSAGQGRLKTYLERTNPALKQQLETAGSTEERFKILTKALAEETDATKKAALASAAFAGSGEDMIKFSHDGVDALEALYTEAEKNGLISEEAAKASEAFADAQTNMKAATMGLMAAALGPLIAKLTPVIQSMAEWVRTNKEVIATGLQGFLDAVGVALSIVEGLFRTGIIPAVLAVIAAWKIYIGVTAAWTAITTTATTVMATYRAMQAAAAVQVGIMAKAQAALNVIMAANPIILIVLAVVALIAILIALYYNWDWVVEKISALGDWLMEKMYMIADAIKNAFLWAWGMIKKVFMTYIDIILTTYGNAIKLIIQGLVKAGKLLKVDTSGLEKVVEKIDETQKSVREQSAFNGDGASSQQSVVESRTTNNNTTVDVNVNAPKGTTTKTSGDGNNVNVRTGYRESTS